LDNKLTKPYLAMILILISSLAWAVALCQAEQATRPFTIVDDIGFAYFGDLYGGATAVGFSPDANYFAVDTERGRLELNRVEDSLRFYRSQDVEDFLKSSDGSKPPVPIWVVNRSDEKGAVIKDWRWLGDSSGVAFLEPTANGGQRLVLANLRKQMIEPLTPATDIVEAFDVWDQQHFVYTVAEGVTMQAERQTSTIVGTGRSLPQLLFPDDPLTKRSASSNCYLWAVVGNKRFEVKHNGAPLAPEGHLALSPDGGSVVTTLLVADVPSSWETLYPPPYASYPLYRIRTGHNSAHQYVRINLQTGSVQALTNAPISSDAGLWAGGSPSWSSDGQAILLPGTFLRSTDNTPSRPCVAVMDLPSNTGTCVEMLKAHTETGVEEGYHSIVDVRFVCRDKHRIKVIFISHLDLSFETTDYELRADKTWQATGQSSGKREVGRGGLEVSVHQSLNEPPRLFAANKLGSRVIWDPNPQFKNIELGEASVYKYKDKKGRKWEGGLYMPRDYKVGHRYPLVIQTHGFVESLFIPSGGFSTAFAARALAANGIMVLHVSDDDGCPLATSDSGPCAVADYEAAANQLVSEGLVDPDKIGIIGFSLTCYYVMETLTTSSLHLKAASITDGVTESYLEYMMFFDSLRQQYDSTIGARPFGEGLQQWFKRSPGFNLDKVNSPLLVVAAGPLSVLSMWQTYAGLHYLKKPVDLIMLNTHEHVLTNPVVRLASQGGSVDWFRFWLKCEEDLDPAKTEQYGRWRELRKVTERNARN
jgi:dipeptidyl aminopeptidase/acylaminoacyl peptidase